MTIPGIALALFALAGEHHIKAASEAVEQGRTAERNHQFAMAADFFEKAIEIEPTYTEAFAALVQVDLEQGRQLEAASALTRWLQIEPHRIRERIVLGKILLDQGQAERALAQFSFALKADAYNADALLGFAAAATKLNMSERAAEAMERGRKRYPGDARFKSEQKPQ